MEKESFMDIQIDYITLENLFYKKFKSECDESKNLFSVLNILFNL